MTLKLLLKALHGRRARTSTAIAGVAACTLLLISIVSVYRSARMAIADYTEQTAIDLWVAPPGSDNLVRGSNAALVPLTELDRIRLIPGVSAADPVQSGFLPVQKAGVEDPELRLTLLTIAYRSPDGLGGPTAYSQGRAPTGPNEVAIDRAAAYRLGVRVGDDIELAGYTATVSGLTSGTNMLATQFVFANFDAVATASRTKGRTAFILVRLSPAADPGAVARAILEGHLELRVHTRKQFTAANQREVTSGFLPLIGLVAILGLGAAALLVGLLILSAVDERRGDIAVLMALGLSAGAIRSGVIALAAELSLGGATIGILCALGLRAALDTWLPTIPLRIEVLDVVAIVTLFTGSGFAAGLGPIHQVGAADPLDAFRS